MYIKKSFLTLAIIGLSSSVSFAQAIDVPTFDELSRDLQSPSSGTSPLNITQNLDFTGNITVAVDSYINGNDLTFSGGSTVDERGIPTSIGSPGFLTTGGSTHTFNNIVMNNFTNANSVSSYGAAINNDHSTVTINNSSFSYNAIYNFAFNEPFNYGGAVDNFGGEMSINDSYFYANVAGGGGAVSAIAGTTYIRNSTFKNNLGFREKANDVEGGAIANYGDLYVYDSLFDGNAAISGDALISAYGGAIYNANGENAYIYNSTFINNFADDDGGAIFNDWNLFVYAKDGANSVFSGNTADGVSNAIHNTCYIELLAEKGSSIIFNDAITSTAAGGGFIASTIKIGEENYNGNIILNADMSDVLGNNILQNGTIKIGNDMGVDASGMLNMFGSGMSVNTVSSGKAYIDMQNNNFDNYKTGNNVTLTTDLYANIDVNLATKTADKFFDLADAGGSGSVIIEGIDIKADASANNFPVLVSENGGDRILLSTDARSISTPIHTYSVSDEKLATDGTLIFNVEGYHNSVLASGASKKAHSVLLTDITKHVLTPNATQTPVGNLASGDENPFASFWIDTKMLSEDVDLNDVSVDNDTYIAIAGFDIKGDSFDNWSKTYSLYGGYVGSRQKYDGVTTNQDGVAVGGGVRFEKGEFFTGLTANFITSFVDGNNEFGDEKFNIYSTSVANKTGMHYHFEDGRYTLKPSVILGYHFVHTEDYTNAADVKIKADDLHIFHISPEIKFITNFENGFNPYVAAAYHWNIENGGETTANEALLPSLSVDNYAEFAVGFEQKTKDGFDFYAEAIFTSGDRTGGGGHIGIKWDF